MANITLAIPEKLKKRLGAHSEIRWSEVIRRVLEERLRDLEIMDELVSSSRFAQDDAFDIGEKIKKGIAKRHGIK